MLYLSLPLRGGLDGGWSTRQGSGATWQPRTLTPTPLPPGEGQRTSGLLVVVLDLGELGIDHVISRLPGSAGVATGSTLLTGRSCGKQRLAGFFQRLGPGFDLRLVVALHRGFQI